MNYAIEHTSSNNQYLVVTPRKKITKHTLLVVHKGLALVKLGKHEYVIEESQAFWLPIDCLTSITLMPHTRATEVNFSIRIDQTFPHQAGYVKLNQIIRAVIDKLTNAKIEQDYKTSLLSILKFEAIGLRPSLKLNGLSESFSQWRAGAASQLDQNIQLALTLREARKRILSGTKKDQVINELFSGSKENFEKLCLTVLGKAL